MRLDLKENIVFPFSDPEWVMKLLKISLCYFFGITAPAVVGYQLAVIRETANGEDEKLPEFGSDFGAMWVKGLVFGLLMFVLLLVPMLGIGALAAGGVIAFGDNELLGSLLGGGAALLITLTCFGLMVLMPALMLRYSMTGEAGSLFDVGSALNDIKQGPGDYAMIFLIPMAASFLSLGVSFTGIGMILVIPITVLTLIVQGRMLGNYYRAYFH